ncbi:MAG: hypothetical protein H7276_13205 [Caulobacter sp.]|nr:hypothetical protein [Vitreoscilla sp.]
MRRVALNVALIRHPAAPFVMRAAGTGMVEAGIAYGDVLLVDRAVPAAHGAVIIAVVQGELLCRRLEREPGRARGTPAMRLVAADGVTAPIALGPEVPLEVGGGVTTVIKTLAF